ncbi:MAG: Cell division protein ftsA [Parcubacteria group bacterium GW2011_GWA2_50_10b]|nr:MAG: Cell division protein ftsA [Parcubacteria group bacterium GW2011_GWA2_50_10b]
MGVKWNRLRKNYYMARQIITGIDIGSFQTKVVIAEHTFDQGHFAPRIIGTGVSDSRGVERGYVTHAAEAAISVKTAVARAEKMAGIRVKRAYVSFGGIGLGSVVSSGTIAISRADLEVTEHDLDLALEVAEAAIPKATSLNKKIINTIPVEWKIDGKPAWGAVVGLKAQKLEVKALFITCLEHHLSELIKTVEEAGVEVADVVAAPVAASFVTVSKKQRRVGCLFADIGAETLSILVFENNNIVSLEVFPIGGSDITNDIALGLKMGLDDAENVKLGGFSRTTYAKKKLDEIIFARLEDCFELIHVHLKKLGRDALLPAGIILTGGSAATQHIKELSEEVLSLPSQVAEIHFGSNEKNKIKETIWATACGLSLLGFNADNEQSLIGRRNGPLTAADGKDLFQKASRWISQLLP